MNLLTRKKIFFLGNLKMSDDFSFCEVSIQVLLNIIRLRTCFIFIMCVQTRSRKLKDEQKEGKYWVFV